MTEFRVFAGLTPTFLDRPDLTAALSAAPGLRVLTVAELNGPADAAQWSGSLGEALFHYRD